MEIQENMKLLEHKDSSRIKTFKLKELQRVIFPIRRHELKTFVPTFFMFFLLTFTYDMLRILKSTLVVGESGVGAEMIPFLKVWAVIPGAFIATTLIIKISHRYYRERIFYSVLCFFIIFFLSYMFFLFPHRKALEASTLGLFLNQILPLGAKGFVAMVVQWPLTLFYVVTELWGSILLSMLIWGFVNEKTNIKQATRFYPLFLFGSNSAAIFAGISSSLFSKHKYSPDIPYGANAWDQTLGFYLTTAIFCTLLIMFLIFYIHLQNPVSQDLEIGKRDEKIKLSLKECFACIAHSRHLILIALLVLSYNLVFNLSDVLWENQLKQMYLDDTAGMAHYKSIVTLFTGGLSVLISLLVSGAMLRNFGWKYAAFVTPVTILVTCVGFFGLMLFNENFWVKSLVLNITSNPIELLLLMGSIQIIFSRGCKYTLFDTSKEMAFIPLSTVEKRYGKAAIDGVGSRVGKSVGSLLIQILLITHGTLAAATPFLAVAILFILGLWCLAVYSLSHKLPI